MQPLHPHAQIAVPADARDTAIYRALIQASLTGWSAHGIAAVVSETAEHGVFELALSPLERPPDHASAAPPLRGSVWVELNFLEDDRGYMAPVSVVWELPAQAHVPDLLPQKHDATRLPTGLPW
jgi:hypothetical protein